LSLDSSSMQLQKYSQVLLLLYSNHSIQKVARRATTIAAKAVTLSVLGMAPFCAAAAVVPPVVETAAP
jgi:hypothetical protein